jgi:hypothetical protein
MIAAEYMTAAEISAATQRLRELEEKKLLPSETIRDLWRWWREKIRADKMPNHPKVILFPSRSGSNADNHA